MADHRRFMAIAIEEARLGAAAGEQPFGAVVARDGEVVAQARSLKVGTHDTTAHSELLAIKAASMRLRQRVLTGCVFYATCEPCPMCLGSILNAGIETLVIGVRKRRLDGLPNLAYDFKDYTPERFAEMVGWRLTVIDDVLGDECYALYADATVTLTR